MIDQRYYQGVNRIQSEAGDSGTCFLLDRDETNYVVSAKHIFPNVEHGKDITFSMMAKGDWHSISGTVFLHKEGKIDIIAIKIKPRIVKGNPFKLSYPKLFLGSSAYFLGFPYGYETQDKTGINVGYPIPLVKGAIYSGVRQVSENVFINLFDGHNNPGFSGGPIFINEENKFQLAGVISAYVAQSNELQTPFGKVKYSENSGIIVSYGSNYLFELLDRT